VNSIEVTDGVTHITHILAGDIEVCAGYNIELVPAMKDVSFRSGGVGVSLSATPGAGLGVSPSDCAPAGVLRSINTVGPDDRGHFKFTALDCYRCYIPCATPSPQPTDFDPLVAAIQVANDCVQCCKCKDYENVYKALARLHDKGRNSGLRMARTIDDLNDLKKEVNRQKDMREIPTMSLMLMPSPGYFMGVQVLLLNNPTFPELDMDQDDRDFALVRMKVTSEAGMSGAVIVPTAMYLYNNRYGNPWIRVVDKAKLFVPTPVDLADTDGTGLIVKQSVVASKFYNVIRTTEYIAMSFQIAWKSSVSPQDGQVVTVTLESDIFKPYTLTKVEKLMQPLDVDGIIP